jgi:DNA-binding transcriptional regulator YhcF (GntR family)
MLDRPRTPPEMAHLDVSLRRGTDQSYFQQAKAQIVSLIYFGKLRAGDRLPSARRLAGQLAVNPKTIERIYRKLRDEDYLDIRPRSGVRVKDQVKTMPDGRLGAAQLSFVRQVIRDAQRLGLTADKLAELVRVQAHPTLRRDLSVLVVECNRDQVLGFAQQIERALGIAAHPVMLSELNRPRDEVRRQIAAARCLVTTHFHWEEVCRWAAEYDRAVVEIRLNPHFFDPVLTRRRRGTIGLISADRTFAAGFRAALTRQRPKRSVPFATADAENPTEVDQLLSETDTVFVTPPCADRIQAWQAHSKAEIVPLDDMIAQESLDMMEASLVAG